jgi:broad specificity phosphatase PhoE/predicted kinase
MPMPEKLLIVMVGLPARGKTYVARKIKRYLAWLGYRSRLFNAGDYRRELFGAKQEHGFFSPENREGEAARLTAAKTALADAFAWLHSEGDVAIFDATNTTRARRQLVRDLADQANVRVLFVEIVVHDPSVIEATIRETKVSSPDYANVDPEAAVRDFRSRITHYERNYETIGEDECRYVKYVDKGRQIVSNRVFGEPERTVVGLLSHLRDRRQPIWLTRHGESNYNREGLLGGDPGLSPAGSAFAQRLAAYVRGQDEPLRSASVWTSALKRTQETARDLGKVTRAFRELDEIDAGICEGMSYADIQARMPDEFAARKQDKFRYRYPRGESYEDVVRRVSHVVLAYEAEARPVLVVGHQAVLRMFYAYLLALPPHECTHLSIPLHTVIELTPGIYDMKERRIPLE